MTQESAEVQLLFTAKNLTTGAVNAFKGSLGALATGAEKARDRISGAFHSVSNGVVNGLGNLTETLAQGGGLGPAMFAFGAYMAGQAAEALLENFIERMAESGLVQALGAAVGPAFSALGSFISTAISVGMAAFPLVLAAVIIGAIIFLINNPDILGKIGDFALSVLHGIGDALAGLGKLLLGLFGAAWQLVVDAVSAYVHAVVAFWLGLPGLLGDFGRLILNVFIGAFNAVATFIGNVVSGIVGVIGGIIDAVRTAIAWIDKLISKQPDLSHMNERGDYSGGRGHASGGWVGLHGPEWGLLGEKGPEYINRNGEYPGAGRVQGVVLEGVTAADILDIVDRGLYVRMRRRGGNMGARAD